MLASNVTPVVFGLVKTSTDDAASAALDELVDWMRRRAGIELTVEPSTSYEALAKSVRAHTCDLAWLPPVVYARLAEAVTPLGSILRDGMASYSAALVVGAESSIRGIEALEGVRAAWVDPWSAAGFVVPRIELAKRGVDPSVAFRSEHFLGSHEKAVRAVSEGDCDVAATYARAPEAGGPIEGSWSALEGVSVRAIATLGTIPTDVLAVRRNVVPATYETLLDAVRRACADDAARPLVRVVFGGDELREGVEPGHETFRLAVESAIASGVFD